jgi:hypothetical protein
MLESINDGLSIKIKTNDIIWCNSTLERVLIGISLPWTIAIAKPVPPFGEIRHCTPDQKDGLKGRKLVFQIVH